MSTLAENAFPEGRKRNLLPWRKQYFVPTISVCGNDGMIISEKKKRKKKSKTFAVVLSALKRCFLRRKLQLQQFYQR